jgi:hypothetical protein
MCWPQAVMRREASGIRWPDMMVPPSRAGTIMKIACLLCFYIASIIRFNVALGRIARLIFSISGR